MKFFAWYHNSCVQFRGSRTSSEIIFFVYKDFMREIREKSKPKVSHVQLKLFGVLATRRQNNRRMYNTIAEPSGFKMVSASSIWLQNRAHHKPTYLAVLIPPKIIKRKKESSRNHHILQGKVYFCVCGCSKPGAW